VASISEHLVARSHRRYGLLEMNPTIAEAWTLLADSVYTQPVSDLDPSGVKYFPAWQSQFEDNRRTATPLLCKTFAAWEKFVNVATSSGSSDLVALRTFRYDLVDLGRELLAQLSSPISLNFSDAMASNLLSESQLAATGGLYVELLEDIDRLVATDPAFLLGPWLAAARAWGSSNAGDCLATDFAEIGSDCANFYEWNARVQLTTWKPTPKNATEVVSEADGHTLNNKETDGEVDYAGKHWSGLIRDYYAVRARLFLQQAVSDARKQHKFDLVQLNRQLARLAYNWTTSTKQYPLTPQGDAVEVSKAMLVKYRPYYQSCVASVG
jgi:alpha-N-acetylglucosaminidase